MGIGIRKTFGKVYFRYNVLKFDIRKFLFGFDNANNTVRNLDKISLYMVLRKYGASLGNDCDIESGLTFHNCSDYKNLFIGDNVHIGKNCFFDLADEVRINSNVVVSMNTNFITHLNMKKSDLIKIYESRTDKVVIGSNTYIGANATLLMGVELGERCFIAAGTVVTKSFNRNSFIAGVPAKLKRTINS